ncbi:cytosine permease [Rhizobium leguminosarum]|uniref:purine-cytosine permease family protein n=1 Tax=Rhizobium leguminosarum TaxID=384 RepID=UPI001C9123A2|nr:cytosine permease [Rhizobium leguminosarum]MBY2925792.1 cytosine permease [Rhizobium leguminosarum]
MSKSANFTSDELSAYDVHGIAPVPVSHRTSSPLDQFWIWAGANVAPINWVLGALGIQMGLSLWDTFLVIAIGNLVGAALFATFCLMGYRTGVPQMALTRLAFGRRGAYLPTFVQLLMAVGWVATNTWIVLDLSVAALDRMGIGGGMEVKYAIALVIMVVQIGIAAWGFNAIKYFERYTMPAILLIMVAMTFMASFTVDIQWSTSTVTGIARWSAMSQLMTAIGIGWGISWLVYASDYTRFSKPGLKPSSVFKATFLGMFVPTVWLATLGAAIASAGVGSDPAQLIIAAFGVMALPVLLVLVHGPIATNIVVIYSAALSSLAMDINKPRWVVSLACGVAGSIILYGFMQSQDFAHAFETFMVTMVVWISPWAGVTAADFFVMRRGSINVDELYKPHTTSRLGDVNWTGVLSLLVGVFAAYLFQMSVVEVLQGPLALGLGGIDLSWLAGFVVAFMAYIVSHKLRRTADVGASALTLPVRGE